MIKVCENCDERFEEEDLSRDDQLDWYCEACKEEGHGEWEEREYNQRIDVEFERRHR